MEKNLIEIKPKSKGKADVKDLVSSFKEILTTDQDKMGYINWRYPGTKKIVFFCIGRKNFITVSTRNDTNKSGWKSQRLYTKKDLNTFVGLIKTQIGGGN